MEFLRQVADIYLTQERDTWMNACFVFPNRRSSLFFRKYLGQQAGGAIFSPPVTTINALFYELSDRLPVDRIGALLRLYGLYRDLTGDQTETLEHFLVWGDLLLNDFSDLDKYLVDAQQLFANIHDLRELDTGYDFLEEDQLLAIRQFWSSFRKQSPSSNEQSFKKTWEILYPLYQAFNQELAAEGLGYDGALYRRVVEQLSHPDSAVRQRLDARSRYVFVGLNALTACERKLLAFLRDEQRADFYWDYAGSLIRDPYNKASWFVQENLRDFPSLHELSAADAPESMPEVTVIGVPSLVGQAKYVGRLLEETILPSLPETDADRLFKTAIVLPQEQLLDPLLESLPQAVDRVNVTMGYPLHNSKIQSFFRCLAQLVDKCRCDGESRLFYHASLLNLLNHPCLCSQYQAAIHQIRSRVTQNNLIYVPESELTQLGIPEFGQLFGQVPLPRTLQQPDEKIAYVREVADYFIETFHQLGKNFSPVDKEFLYHLYAVLVRLRDLNLPLELKSWLRILDQLTAGVSIPYRGEPLSGLQVMGPLETRALDFENLVLLSVNEGVFPRQAVSNSFIPYQLRKGFGLPTYEQQDAIQAYYFYRMISRAQRVWLLYDQRTEGMKTGEESRFIKQLRYQYRLPLQETTLESEICLAQPEEVVVHKTPAILERLRTSSFSASSLNNYLKCPLMFFFGTWIQQQDEVVEDVEASTFGTLFHKVIQLLYEPMVGNEFDDELVEEILNGHSLLLEKKIAQAFRSEMNVSEITGKNRIIAALLKRIALRVLEQDLNVIPVLEALEQKRITPFELSDGSTVLLKGFIDRIDRKFGNWRIVDYKTGGSSMEYKQVEEMFDVSSEKRPYTAFQLYFYDLLCRRGTLNEPDKPVYNPKLEVDLAVYSAKDLFKDVVPTIRVTPQDAEKYAQLLKGLLDEILDPTKPFVRTSRRDGFHSPCEYCSFVNYCNTHYVKNL